MIALEDSKTMNIAYHTTDPNVGEDRSRMKMYVGDTGLMVTLAFWDKNFTGNMLYDKLLADRLTANMGYIFENLAAQMLRSSGNNLYFYSSPLALETGMLFARKTCSMIKKQLFCRII